MGNDFPLLRVGTTHLPAVTPPSTQTAFHINLASGSQNLYAALQVLKFNREVIVLQESSVVSAEGQKHSKPGSRRGIRSQETVEPGHVGLNDAVEQDLVVHSLSLADIDLRDHAFRFRAVVRVPDLVKSLSEFGQQIPAVVRPHPSPNSGFRYQLISGFRRAAALLELGAQTISAYVRRDLSDDAEAFRASVLENIARKTYSDIDRAYIIRQLQAKGYPGVEAAQLMNLSKRQKNNLLSLLDLPADVQAALTEEGKAFTTTHALTLRKLKRRHRGLDYAEWIARVNSEGLSIPQMVRAINESQRRRSEPKPMASIFRHEATDLEKGVVHLRPLKFDVAQLTTAEKRRLRDELEGVLRHLSKPD